MGRSPFIGDKPLDSIVLAFEGGYSGYKEYNSPSDPMPIKTMNNNGLQVLEEVPGEYKIYIDKDAVMTTVAKYAPGSYQTFMERKADVDNSRSLLKVYSIEWTQQDDSNLFIQCNDEAIYKIENQPMTLDEPTQPVVLEPKTVPTTYDCCFRVGNDGVYVGEGYENIWSNAQSADLNTINSKRDTGVDTVYYNNTVNGGEFKLKGVPNANVPFIFIKPLDVYVNDVISSTGYCEFSKKGYKVSSTGGIPSNVLTYSDNVFKIENATMINANFMITILKESQSQIGEDYDVEVYFKNFQTTKTSNHKPFVKSVMPSGKLDRITNANETTHTFLNKGDGVVTFGNGYFSLKGEKIQQLLVYKGILTEEQKQIELNKTFKVR